MALHVGDVLRLQSLQGFRLISGKGGLKRYVCSAEIADYEFAENVEYHNSNAFEKESFVISSLLFAQNDPGRILEAVKELNRMGTSAFAYKDVIYKELPPEVLQYSEEQEYPIFVFGQDVYFENIIFEIMDAVQRDDTEILAEHTIKKMIEGELSRDEVTKISKSVSLIFQKNVRAAYIRPRPGESELDMSRIFRNFYLSKNLKTKILPCRYQSGLFLIMTSPYGEAEKFEVILREALENLSIDRSKVLIARSRLYDPYEELDLCMRESWHTYIAGIVSRREYGIYEKIGAFRYLVPLKDSAALREFSKNYLQAFGDKEELADTAVRFVLNQGDIARTADELQCHQNTIRYRVARIKELTESGDKTDFEFYQELSTAVRIELLRQYQENERMKGETDGY